MIAQTIRDNPDPNKHMARLSQMLRDSDQRPKFKLPQTWVAMDGGLLLPKRRPPPESEAPNREDAPATPSTGCIESSTRCGQFTGER